ncbi:MULTISPECIES: GH116 family glycosyl hydrolase [unclassified Dysgonomonas]|uniref:GH116 family glycosyl hydrolase n=1 Tax=unclassified Dysgonomonas TaxID=2630389 RepID=UPI0025C13C23|nr:MULTISPECIES: GH116 family glycosyl hydrolase [unclassified Dysgonomonas]HMM03164.1 GH116 family glycosyl hydrolase [Dysgonomonas sp.]
MKKVHHSLLCMAVIGLASLTCCTQKSNRERSRIYNEKYTGDYTNRIAFPIGGMGTGMFCLEGSGAISNMSLRHRPEVFHEPAMFAALHIKDVNNTTKILEGQVPDWKKFGMPLSALGGGGTWGLPRYKENTFTARFPFAEIELKDDQMPVDVKINAWNPFIPTDADNSSLPVGGLEYEFKNTGDTVIEAIFSYNTRNFMYVHGKGTSCIKSHENGFILYQSGAGDEPFHQGEFAIFTDDPETKVNHNWFRGGWFDPLTICWNNVVTGTIENNPPELEGATGASLFVPVKLEPGEVKTVKLYMAWYVPYSNLRIGGDPKSGSDYPNIPECTDGTTKCYPYDNKGDGNYRPWYSNKFENIKEVSAYWLKNYNDLKSKTKLFTEAFYNSTLPAEVVEAVTANLTILKSPTVFRQYDGRMWNWEGCGDTWGSCHGSCTHVWNYAQAVPHLFPAMERTLRETEYYAGQNKEGHQVFRSNLPIRPVIHDFHSAADGQLGGIMKVYREWRISGDNNWLKEMYPFVKASMDYCIRTWDPREVGAIEEPHHNTYDIEFWGADGMITSFYTGALQAICLMGKYLGEDISRYEALMDKSKVYMETKLFDGEYFIQNIQWKGLNADDPTKVQAFNSGYSDEALKILEAEGPKYQYGKGCLSDGILGSWMSIVCGMPEIIDKTKVTSHLNAVHKYNLKHDLREHANPQRPTFAMGNEGGLLLCSWPKGGKPKLPFVYSDEVWTGIEYQVAAHLMFEGEVEKGLEIVRACRDRYSGEIRNPFNEYECGAWYARAMASYALLEGLTGIRYDAVDKTIYFDSRIGDDFVSFLSTDTGFANVGLKNGKPFLEVKYGEIDIQECLVSGRHHQIDIKK